VGSTSQILDFRFISLSKSSLFRIEEFRAENVSNREIEGSKTLWYALQEEKQKNKSYGQPCLKTVLMDTRDLQNSKPRAFSSRDKGVINRRARKVGTLHQMLVRMKSWYKTALNVPKSFAPEKDEQ